MKALTENTEDTGKIYNEFKQLQQKWNEIKQIPVGKINELWKTYQLYTEKFYDMVKLNNEFREYDFKKNLEQKTYLCEAAENWQKNQMLYQLSINYKNYIRNSAVSVL